MRWILTIGALGTALMVRPVAAQQVTVQQPVVSSFGVGTTVSVPDRGWTHLGSVNSAAAGRSSFGLPRTSSSIGLQTQGSSTSVGVYIHDLQAMDEALLATAANSALENVWDRRLVERRGALPPTPIVSKGASPPSRAAEFETRAQRAEQNGKPAVALTYWRLAAKEGSALARTRLAETPTASTVAAKSARSDHPFAILE